MCEKCRWRDFVNATWKLIESNRLPAHRSYLRGVIAMVSSRGHITRWEAKVLAKYECDAGFYVPPGTIQVRPRKIPEIDPIFKSQIDELLNDTQL